MKQTITLLLLLLLLVACGRGDEETATTAANVPTATTVTDAPTVAATVESDSANSDSAETDTGTANAPTDSPFGSDYLGSYEFADAGFGTMVTVTVDNDANTRTIVSNALPNHETGEFPNPGNPNTISEQDKTWTYTTEPVFVGRATNAREPGVAINGVKFEPGTAERATCESGEVHSIEAIQNFTDLGLDFNLAHVQPTGEYHYHGVSALLVEINKADRDLVHIGFAADGHLIYYSKSNAYQSSYLLGTDAREGTNCTYTPGGPNGGATVTFGPEKDGSLATDWDYDPSNGQLDECNGIMVDGQYIYLMTDAYPYIPRCLMGETAQGGPGGGQQGAQSGAQPGGQGSQPGGQAGPGGGQGDRPNFAAAAATLGISEQELLDAVGGPPPNFEAAATALGISVEAIEAAVEGSRGTEAGPPPAEAAVEPTAAAVVVDTASESVTFQMDAWADNWFAAYLGNSLIVEDSVSITTERSFNSESVTFEASYPLHLNFILKDFKENDTGLEYIGERNQQMGDGGFIMQLTDMSTGDVVAVTDGAFACLVVHEAPLDKSCESESNPVAGTAPCGFTETSEPEGWLSADFDDSAWTATTIHTSAAVDPKQGYDNISWDDSAEFIWGPDLETNNTVLCRVTIDAP